MEATQVLTRRCDLPPLRFDSKAHGSYSVNQKQQFFLFPMSRREGSGQSHIPRNVPEDIRRDDRQPSVQLPPYVEHTMPPSTPHARSDPPQYALYNPPPSSRLVYPSDHHARVDTRHTGHPQRHMDLTRSHERGILYPRQGEFYPPEVGVPPAHQPAPRQRTAVACRYCRRRKV